MTGYTPRHVITENVIKRYKEIILYKVVLIDNSIRRSTYTTTSLLRF